MRTFTRPGYQNVTVTQEQIAAVLANPPADCPFRAAQLNELSAAYYVASAVWKEEGRQIAAALNITAEEYARQARRAITAEFIEAGARAYAVRPDSQSAFGRAVAASLFRQAARAHEAANS